MTTEYKDGLFDVTRTVNSWLAGFPARLERVERELGRTKPVQEAKAQHRAVKKEKGGPARDVYAAAFKLNGMLEALESEARGRREAENENDVWRGFHEPGCRVEEFGSCGCFE